MADDMDLGQSFWSRLTGSDSSFGPSGYKNFSPTGGGPEDGAARWVPMPREQHVQPAQPQPVTPSSPVGVNALAGVAPTASVLRVAPQPNALNPQPGNPMPDMVSQSLRRPVEAAIPPVPASLPPAGPVATSTATQPATSQDTLTPQDRAAGSAPVAGVDPKVMRAISAIESGNNPNAITGSYHGLFQLSRGEFARYGGKGDILNPEANTMAATRKIAAESSQFQSATGKKPDASDIYMIHQQGMGGYTAHLKNPDRPAWENMASTAEGRQKGEKWAKAAIWGNLPQSAKDQFGSVDKVTSQQFTDWWKARVARQMASK